MCVCVCVSFPFPPKKTVLHFNDKIPKLGSRDEEGALGRNRSAFFGLGSKDDCCYSNMWRENDEMLDEMLKHDTGFICCIDYSS